MPFVLALSMAGAACVGPEDQAGATPLILIPRAGGADYAAARRQVDARTGEYNNVRNRIVITDDAALTRLANLVKTTGLRGDERFTLTFFDDIVCTLSSMRTVGSGPRDNPDFPLVGYEQFAAGCEEFDQPGHDLRVFIHPDSGDSVLSLSFDSDELAPEAETFHAQYFVSPINGTNYSRSGEFDIQAMFSGRVIEPRWE